MYAFLFLIAYNINCKNIEPYPVHDILLFTNLEQVHMVNMEA